MVDPIFIIFQEEAREHLRRLEQSFLDLETTADVQQRRAIIDSLFRHAHTLKGDARVIGLEALQESAQHLEELLEQFRSDPRSVDEAAINEGLARLDRVRLVFERWQAEWTPTASAPAPETVADAAEPPLPTGQPPIAEDAAGETPLERAAVATAVESGFMVRVPSEQLDRMLNLVGEVQITQRAGAALVNQITELRKRLENLSQGLTADPAALDAAYDYIRRIESEHRKQQAREQVLLGSLEAEVRQARLLPLTMLAESLRRPVRDLAQSLGKKVRYQVDVGDVLLDKAVIEALKTPLLHLIRNAIDHGIELPEERRAAGKPEEGAIRFTARQRGEIVRIAVADDGGGLPLERIRQRLLSHLRLSEADVQQMSERELAAYLFQPGFTTAEVGSVSGRGVGLDAVRDAIARLQGRIELAHASPQGTAFELTVPVTISTIRILSVWSGGHCYGIPTAHIQRSGRIQPAALRELEGRPVLPQEGGAVPWVPLAELVDLGTSRSTISQAAMPYLVVNAAAGPVAVAVDELDEEREVLLKPLGFPLANMPGVIGGAIRPDGSVQLVLDLTGDAFRRRSPRSPQPVTVQRTRVLVVDDSPTTRALLRNLLTQAGFAVRTAVDGIDALEKLRTHPVDIVISDFEMPRLGGVDLTRQIKAQYGLPVILVTAREQEHHRRQGLEAGADAYVVKSTFQGESLIDILRQFG